MEYATHSGDISRELANYLGEDGPDKWLFTSPTGSFPANPLGIHDMSGNVYEWTTDTYDPKAYASHHGRDPKVEGEGERVKRGGSFGTDKSYLRAANRGSSGFAANDLGFRLVMEP
jgi:formylglycine-generating enzyme required for sulfatase activity